jgi:hypothetical protein
MDYLAYVENAARCRRLANAIAQTDPGVKVLLTLAAEFEGKAAALAAAIGMAIPSPK